MVWTMAPSPSLLVRLAAAILIGVGCQCLEPVAECGALDCTDAGVGDGGARDAGASDAGSRPDAGPSDAGRLDAGTFDGGPFTCDVWDGGGVGRCAAITGYIFHGTTCEGACVLKPLSAPGLHDDLPSCAACGCDRSKLVAIPPLTQPFGPDTVCDDLLAVTNLPRLLSVAFPGYDTDAGCRPIGSVDWSCLLWRHQLGPEGFARACAATLVPRVSQVRCMVYLP